MMGPIKLSTHFLSVLSLLFLLGCQAETNFNNPHDQGDRPVDPLSDEALAGSHQLQVKTLYSAVEAMSQRTGIYPHLHVAVGTSTGNDRIAQLRTYINSNVTSLPVDPLASTLSPAHLVALTNLAYEYCKTLIDSDDLRAEFFEGTDFGGYNMQGAALPLPAFNILTTQNESILVNLYLDRFWGVRINKPTSRLNAEDELSSLLTELRTSNNLGVVMKGLCTAALSSAPAVLR
jgi:hypothetical protein